MLVCCNYIDFPDINTKKRTKGRLNKNEEPAIHMVKCKMIMNKAIKLNGKERH